MLEVNAPVGNIFSDKVFNEQKSENFERLRLSRTELEKRILRRKTDRGTDVGLNLDSGVKLRHGDVIGNESVKIIIKQQPEKIISIRLKNNNTKTMVLLGHIIGNRHRPISFQKGKIEFPIQADSEKEVFEKLFHEIISHIDLKIEEQIFVPHTGADVHEH